MRQSILVTFDELINDRGIDRFEVLVNNVSRDLHFTDINNYYSTFCFVGDVVRFSCVTTSPAVPNLNIIRKDYTTDDEGGDNGIKETSITPIVLSDSTTELQVQFTATTRNDAYNSHYIFDCATESCFSIGTGFSGTVDPSITDIDLLSTGKFVMSGEFNSYNGTSANRIIQLNADGTVYSGFSYGSGFTPDTTNEIAELSDGRLIIVGQFTNYNGTSCTRIIGLNGNGTVNTGFTTGTGFNVDPGPIERQSDDKVVIGGNFWEYNGTTSPKIIRLNTDGSYDNTFVVGSGFTSGGTFNNLDSEVGCLAIQSDGKIVVGGNFDAYSGTSVTRICRLNSDGSLDNTFSTGTGLNGVPVEIKIQSDGKIVVGGFFTSYNGTTSNRIVRLNTDGSIDTSFSGVTTGFNEAVLAIEFLSDERIVIGGDFTSYNSSSANKIICLNTNGSVNTSMTFGTGFNLYVSAINVLEFNNLLVGGLFNTYKGLSANKLIKLNQFGTRITC